MKKQRRGLHRYNVLQDGKRGKKVSIHMHDTLKLTVKKKKEKKEKKDNNKKGVNGIRTHIHENRWLLV